MDNWELPETALINGREFPIRSDFRAVLDVISILSDPELDDNERGALAFYVFYPTAEDMVQEDAQPAAEFLQWFLSGGNTGTKPPQKKLADWDQDFPIIIGPVNRVLGYEVRSVKYLHWWTFLAAYCEVGDCLFAQVVSIRNKLAKGKKLEKWEREWYQQNRELVDLKHKETREESEEFEKWLV